MSVAPASRLVSAQAHFEFLHGADREGTAFVWSARETKGAWRKIKPGSPRPRIEAVLDETRGKTDCYVSVNAFRGWRRTTLLKTLNACFVDLDLGRPFDQGDFEELADRLHRLRLPMPGLIVESGRGAHLYWRLAPTEARALPLWQQVEDTLIAALRPMKADPCARDCTRMLRLVGSCNGKNDAFVHAYMLDETRWSLDELAAEVLDDLDRPAAEPEQVRRAPRPGTSKACAVRHSGAHYRRWHAVLQDLVLIAEARGRIPQGHRDQWLFLCAVALSWFAPPSVIRREVEALARRYTGLSPVDIARALRCPLERAERAVRGERMAWAGRSVDPRYHFRRQTLLDRIGALIPRAIAGQMRALIDDDEARRRKAARDRRRWKGHYGGDGIREEHRPLREAALALRALGRTVVEIAAKLQRGLSTIKRWLATSAAPSPAQTPPCRPRPTTAPSIPSPRPSLPRPASRSSGFVPDFGPAFRSGPLLRLARFDTS